MTATPRGEPMQIGRAAERTGPSLRTIRFHGESGLLIPTARSEGGFRLLVHDAPSDGSSPADGRRHPAAGSGDQGAVRRSGLLRPRHVTPFRRSAGPSTNTQESAASPRAMTSDSTT